MTDYTVAWQLEGERRPDEAIPLLKAIIAKDKTFWRAYKTLFEAYLQKKELDKAEEYFRSLLQWTARTAWHIMGWERSITAGSKSTALASTLPPA